MRRAPALSLLLLAVFASPRTTNAQAAPTQAVADSLHNSPEWANIAAHLPDPATASPASLELAADVLRARRFDADAVVFYNAALHRGGDAATLLKKAGITCLEMQQPTLARSYFQRAIKQNKKDAIAWNDLGAADFTLRNTRVAIGEYKRAIQYQKYSAAFHNNLALAYFDAGNAEDARHELARAFALDPDLLHRGDGGAGYNAQVLASTRYSEVCFEMARIYASQGKVDLMLEWLAKASERGFNLRDAMNRDDTLRPLLADARVQLILKNTQTLRASNKPPATVPSLGEAGR